MERGDIANPYSISHECDEVWNGGTLEQRYNFLFYRLTWAGRFYSARAYLDTINEVAIFGPFADDKLRGSLSDIPIDPAVLAYFGLRYAILKRFDPKTGYVSIWHGR